MENIFLTTFVTLSMFMSSGIMPNEIPVKNQKAEVRTDKKEIKISKPIAMNINQTKAVEPIIPKPSVSIISSNGPLNETQIQFLGNCESGMTASRNSGNGYFGAFQFSIGTWNSMGTGYARADLAPIEVQIDAVQRLVSRSSIFTQFPGCSRRMQAAGLI